ncbi:MAG: hypothetical protein A2Y25_11005 [Candidatus Melainabacteria bacterium GWF2_37_15]|nr:MAG: hypothetical protein A2Y25_11005 [Candidatus Melainabacteria bacterium GWF2_37_15]
MQRSGVCFGGKKSQHSEAKNKNMSLKALTAGTVFIACLTGFGLGANRAIEVEQTRRDIIAIGHSLDKTGAKINKDTKISKQEDNLKLEFDNGVIVNANCKTGEVKVSKNGKEIIEKSLGDVFTKSYNSFKPLSDIHDNTLAKIHEECRVINPN